MPSPKKKSTEVSKIEVENVPLSQDRKNSILARFVEKKFSAIETKNLSDFTIECAKWHKETYPDMDYIVKKIGLNWFAASRRFSFKADGVSRFRIDVSERFVKPLNTSDYDGHVIEKPSKKLLELHAIYVKIKTERDIFRNDFSQLLSAVNTSKQLCELVPECADLFPKKGNGVGTQLVPIELVRKVRASLAGTK